MGYYRLFETVSTVIVGIILDFVKSLISAVLARGSRRDCRRNRMACDLVADLAAGWGLSRRRTPAA